MIQYKRYKIGMVRPNIKYDTIHHVQLCLFHTLFLKKWVSQFYRTTCSIKILISPLYDYLLSVYTDSSAIIWMTKSKTTSGIFQSVRSFNLSPWNLRDHRMRCESSRVGKVIIPGTMETVFSARSTRKVLRPDIFPSASLFPVACKNIVKYLEKIP